MGPEASVTGIHARQLGHGLRQKRGKGENEKKGKGNPRRLLPPSDKRGAARLPCRIATGFSAGPVCQWRGTDGQSRPRWPACRVRLRNSMDDGENRLGSSAVRLLYRCTRPSHGALKCHCCCTTHVPCGILCAAGELFWVGRVRPRATATAAVECRRRKTVGWRWRVLEDTASEQ
jgi:hypothetical protein